MTAEVPVAGTTAQRRVPALILWLLVALCVPAVAALVLWIQLPRWVLWNSPFVDPVLRAVVADGAPGGPVTFTAMDFEFMAFAQSWDPQVAPALVRALEVEDPQYRAAALCALANLRRGSPFTPDMVERIARLATVGQEPRLRVWALRALHDQRSPALAALRRAAMGDPDQELRAAALADLDPGPDPRDLDPLLAALGDPVPELRHGAVARVVKKVEHRVAIPALIRQLQGETDASVIGICMTALGELRAVDAVPVLGALALRPDGKSGAMALRTAFAISPVAATDALLAALAGPQRAAQRVAAMKLGELREPRAVAPLIALVAEPDVNLAGLAIIALGRIGDAAAIEPVLARLTELGEFAEARHREHELSHIPDSVRLSEDFDFATMLAAVDGLPLSPEQHARWEAIRKP
jgi:HEAT repeat protein